jgi:hypothetical protein
MQGAGKLTLKPCNVIFNAVIPRESERETTPYMIFLSTGTHLHPPPPPNMPPKQLVEELNSVISRMRNPHLTLGMNTF